MATCAKLASILMLGVAVAAPMGRAQVQEKLPSPTINHDWTYTSPGPAKCVEIGNVYLHRGNLKGALSRFEEAIQDDEHYAPAYLGLGKVYERMKDKPEALYAYQHYLDELPSAKQADDAKYARRAVERLQKELGPDNPKAVTTNK
jgi:tetratricopeptide (TPR) repeat protein